MKQLFILIFISLHCAYQKPTPEVKEEFCRTQLLQNLVLGEVITTNYLIYFMSNLSEVKNCIPDDFAEQSNTASI